MAIGVLLSGASPAFLMGARSKSCNRLHDSGSGYEPTQTDPNSELIRRTLLVYKKLCYEPLLWPRAAGSSPSYVFTGAPLNLPVGYFGLG
jgi:hypothetical protein